MPCYKLLLYMCPGGHFKRDTGKWPQGLVKMRVLESPFLSVCHGSATCLLHDFEQVNYITEA